MVLLFFLLLLFFFWWLLVVVVVVVVVLLLALLLFVVVVVVDVVVVVFVVVVVVVAGPSLSIAKRLALEVLTSPFNGIPRRYSSNASTATRRDIVFTEAASAKPPLRSRSGGTSGSWGTQVGIGWRISTCSGLLDGVRVILIDC